MSNLLDAYCEEAVVAIEEIGSHFESLESAVRQQILDKIEFLIPSFHTLRELCDGEDDFGEGRVVRASAAFGFRSCLIFVSRADERISAREELGAFTLDNYLMSYMVPGGSRIFERLKGNLSFESLLSMQIELQLFHTAPAAICALIDKHSNAETLLRFREAVFGLTNEFSRLDGGTDFEWDATLHLDQCLESAVELSLSLSGDPS